MTGKPSHERHARIRLIIVEDNFSIAQSLEYALATAGCEVVGIAGRVKAALEFVTSTSFDVALLDIDVRGENVAPVADAVLQKGKCVVFLTGYGEDNVLPHHLRSLPRLDKPVDPDVLMIAINAAIDESHSG